MQSRVAKLQTNGRISILKRAAAFAGTMVLVGWLVGCTSVAQSKPQGPIQVSVAEVACHQFGESDEFTGRLEAVHNVEVRPRVSGYLESVNFTEGTIVQQGSLLFQIDPRPFQAEVDRLKGDLAEAKAELARAQSDFARA
jgi:multidrug efflux system membrane fusion protein